MTMTSHLSELRKKHRVLSETIEREQRHPASDDLTIKRMKLQKLQLKQEIEKLAEATA
ncbi:YdcH family protein [Amaricoccus tamworthensis]|uniref:YdcH family protein n=1 Tax=Amaricoccus tamworthensis TaxID=57002 RepID=UPI003C7B6E15